MGFSMHLRKERSKGERGDEECAGAGLEQEPAHDDGDDILDEECGEVENESQRGNGVSMLEQMKELGGEDSNNKKGERKGRDRRTEGIFIAQDQCLLATEPIS
ncbi:hypothetical protein CISG_02258 [Coccidioides immitis RMSCC 3703]|uniref:Uncharacterized protein n=1 Tax=Coccidioides immitis RMSCC 3703 TaxID=454286 RepID=A0A0J8U1R2_COCIT|nr:hypothetical protein CISG_02258 [Coccidioides immitis RMSCC 3703]